MLGPIKEFSNAELDKFRSTLSCYIFQAPDKLSVFIYGADSQTVMTALLGLREILLRKIQMLPKEANVPSTADRIPAKILLARLLEPGRLVKIPVTNNILITQFEFREHDAIISLQKIPNVDLPAESEWKAWSKRLDSVQKGVLKLVVLNRISLLMSTGDGCFLKVKMGVCVFKNYIWKPRNAANIPVSDFIQGLEHDRTDAIISNL